jgi:hypothetical protein
LKGRKHITEMENWDEDYFNMEVQAYIEIDERGAGDFQFGLVTTAGLRQSEWRSIVRGRQLKSTCHIQKVSKL